MTGHVHIIILLHTRATHTLATRRSIDRWSRSAEPRAPRDRQRVHACTRAHAVRKLYNIKTLRVRARAANTVSKYRVKHHTECACTHTHTHSYVSTRTPRRSALVDHKSRTYTRMLRPSASTDPYTMENGMRLSDGARTHHTHTRIRTI